MTTQSSQSKYVQHLATYPALTALAGLAASFPIVKIFASNAVPLLQAMSEKNAEAPAEAEVSPTIDYDLDLLRDVLVRESAQKESGGK